MIKSLLDEGGLALSIPVFGLQSLREGNEYRDDTTLDLPEEAGKLGGETLSGSPVMELFPEGKICECLSEPSEELSGKSFS